MNSKVGNGQEFCIDMRIAVKQKVDIDRPRRSQKLVSSAKQILDPDHPCQHLRRTYIVDLDFGNHVQVRCVLLDSYRFRFIEGRKANYAKSGFHKPTDGQ
jgi:hypothetical protein